MNELALSAGEPFTSPAWGSNFVVFSSETAMVIPEQDTKEYLGRACKYAKHYEIYLVPERFMLMGYQCMCLISPNGKVVGAQKATHRNLASKISKQSETLEIFDTPFGSVFLCVDVDIYYPAVLRIAYNMGAQIIICSQQIVKKQYSSSMVLTGCWNASQSNNVFCVGVSNVFNCVCVPLSLSPHEDGFIVPPNMKIPMTAKLNCERLTKCPQPRRLSRKFYAVHQPEFTN